MLRARISSSAFSIDLDFLELFFSDLDGIAFKEDIKDRAFLAFDYPLHGPEDAVDDDPVSRRDLSREIVGDIYIQRLGLFAAPQPFGDSWIRSFWESTNFDRLGISSSFLNVQPSVAHPSGSMNFPYFLFLYGEMAGRAAENRFNHTRADFRGLPQDSFSTDKRVDIIRPDIADGDFLREIGEPDIDPLGSLPSFVRMSWSFFIASQTSSRTFPGFSRSSSARAIPTFPNRSISR